MIARAVVPATAAVAALFLGVPVLVLVILAASGGEAFLASDVTHRPRCRPAQPGHDDGVARADDRRRAAPGLRPRTPDVPWQADRGDRDRSADRPASRGRRPGPPAGLRTARAACRAAGHPRLGDPVHDDRRDPRPDVRRRAVLRAVRPRRDRRRRPRPRGCRARGRSLRTPGVPVRHDPAGGRGPGWRGW